MPAHLSLQIKKSIWLVWRMSARVGTCRHLDVSARVGTFPGVGTFSGADTCQHIPVCKQKVHMISIRDVGTCRHVSAPRRVGTCRHLLRCQHFFRCWHMPAHLSLQIKKSIWLVWRMSARVDTCRHVSAPWRVGTCRHFPRCRHLFRCWHMPAHPSLQTKSPYD